MWLNDVKWIDLPKIVDVRGNLSFIESNRHIPFEIKRAFWIYDVPGGETRGSHAYLHLSEFIIALSGSFDVILDDGREERKFSLNRSYYGLYIPNLIWRSLANFSTNSSCLVLSNGQYNENDYVRDYPQFLKLKNIGT